MLKVEVHGEAHVKAWERLSERWDTNIQHLIPTQRLG